ncbi:MAG TPA: CPBP family intramembrane glutamic endopeptidase [Phycisphaerae bacterium]|nr:CPBP family intramembrane glutamic endopeptidase [Phycisphaerae bacterium]
MGKHARFSVFWDEGYVRQTQRPLTCLAFILLPLAAYHACTLRYGTDLLAPRDVARLLRYFGATANVLPPLMIVVVLLLQHVVHRHRWRVQPAVLAGMLAESALWVVPLFSLNYLTSRLLLAAGAAPHPAPWLQQVLQALGAGIYEEFIFRLVFLSLMLLLLVDLLELRRDLAAVGAVVLGAILFSLYHFSAGQLTGSAPFPWGHFVFRTLAGIYLGGLYVCRGFGIAVGSHAFWNLCVAWVNA